LVTEEEREQIEVNQKLEERRLYELEYFEAIKDLKDASPNPNVYIVDINWIRVWLEFLNG